jgi:hypothetical protein
MCSCKRIFKEGNKGGRGACALNYLVQWGGEARGKKNCNIYSRSSCLLHEEQESKREARGFVCVYTNIY